MKAMAPYSSTPAWKIPWTEEPGRLQSMGSLRVGHDWATSLSLFTFLHWRRKWQPTQCSCLENPRDGEAWWAAVYGVAQSRTWLKRLSSSSFMNIEIYRLGLPVGLHFLRVCVCVCVHACVYVCACMCVCVCVYRQWSNRETFMKYQYLITCLQKKILPICQVRRMHLTKLSDPHPRSQEISSRVETEPRTLSPTLPPLNC